MLLGSQFGDWDNPNNFLRAPLASPGWTLTSCWAGNPPYTFHRMAMGEPIGYSLLRTQNATEDDYYPGPQLVHVALMGDPSLRLHPVGAPGNLTATANAEELLLQWTAPPGETLAGYHVYRADSLHGHFTKLNNTLVGGTTFTDGSPLPGNAVYMVRAVKLEQSGSGTYWNLSLGTLVSAYFDPCAAAPFEGEVFVEICEGEIFEMGDSIFTAAGIYEMGFLTEAGCDSTLQIHLAVLPHAYTEIDTFFSPPGIDFYGVFYENDTTLTLQLEANNGCDSVLTANLFLVNSLIAEGEAPPGVLIYPNPARGSFFIETKKAKTGAAVEVWNGVGQCLLREKMNGKLQVETKGWPSGLYFLKTKWEGKVAVMKLVLLE
jgi:hypothetical protein